MSRFDKTCPICGSTIEGEQKYCSKRCARTGGAINRSIGLSVSEHRHPGMQAETVRFAAKAKAHGMSYGQYEAYVNGTAASRKREVL